MTNRNENAGSKGALSHVKNDKDQRYIEKIENAQFPILMLAGIINAFGVTIFLFPVKLYDSGISDLSMLLDQVHKPILGSCQISGEIDEFEG